MKISELNYPVRTISPFPRWGHWILDMFLIQLVLYVVNLIPLPLVTGFFSLLIYPGYYILFEYLYGSTPGKMVTKTIVIDEYGNRPDIQSIILRSFIRFVPFEPFSCFDDNSRGWHDRWTDTYVVYIADLPAIKEAIGVTDGSAVIAAGSQSKMNKNLLIAAIVILAGVSGYFLVKQAQALFDKGFTGQIEDMNNADYGLIEGNWNTEWVLFKKLNFQKNSTLVATNQAGDTLLLQYSINTKILSIKDTAGLKLDYFMQELTSDKMVLRDMKTMSGNIELTKE